MTLGGTSNYQPAPTGQVNRGDSKNYTRSGRITTGFSIAVSYTHLTLPTIYSV